MHKYITIAAALAVGTMWSIGPASAQTTTTDRVEQKAERAADKTERAADKAADKAESTKETIKDKAENAKDTIKDKAVRAKDNMKEKFAHAKDKMRSANDRMVMADTRAAQQALKTQGFDPGPIDGRMGPRTRAALNDYQRKNDVPVTGMLDDATMAKLEVRSTRGTDVPAASPANRPDPKKQTQ
ncbi:MAG TPA: peptidoglycan-binding domain-containing protein [Candidatus Acidoferrum sp.]|nr:peptidoglycan-binding domain-containing protein [Candidatus Acidoferrum sp.]